MIQTAAAAALAFSAPHLPLSSPMRLVMQEAVMPEAVAPPPAPPAISVMRVGDKTLAGDYGFDPMQLADSPDKLAWYREAEVKHARLAMLAAFGWPVSEVTNFGKLLTNDGRAPSLLNGGLGDVNGVYWAAVVGLAVYWESQGLDKQFSKKSDYLPGMLGEHLAPSRLLTAAQAVLTLHICLYSCCTLLVLRSNVFFSLHLPLRLESHIDLHGSHRI